MCVNLVKIKNPCLSHRAYGQEFGSLVTINKNLIPSTDYINVPCGKCEECRASYINSIIQRCIIESLYSYVFFVTLTYDNEHLPHIDINGERFFYCEYDHIKDMFKRFRNTNCLGEREFRYLCVSEYGERKNRPHFHLLLFVSKLDHDDSNTPYVLENTIFKHLGSCFTINKGTRKNPIYEQLFTYKVRGNKTNYYVKYVDNDQFLTFVNNDFVVKHHNVKAIKYLVNYTFKPSKYEQHIDCVINSYKDDTVLYNKLRALLRCKLNYSKGLGCGYDCKTGKRVYLEKISVRCSSNTHLYTEIYNSLPDSYEEFVDCYPNFNEQLIEWRDRDFYQYFSTWRRCLNSMDSEQYMMHCVYLKYFRSEFDHKYNRFKKELQPKISNFFKLLHNNYFYDFKRVKTYDITDSHLYRYLRSMVEESISKKLLCISFRLENNYVPLCKYYRERVTTFDDQYRLYEALGVTTYEEWLDLFEKTINNRKAVEASGNVVKYFNDDLIEDDVQFLDNSAYLYKNLFADFN